MDDKEFEKWEKGVEENKKRNELLLREFENHLKNKSLSDKTISNHVFNVDFFVNDYLLRYDVIPAVDGIDHIGSFLGDYFIRKATWSSKSTINENVASFKKFYGFLAEIGKISKEKEQELKQLVKEEKKYWIEEVERYSNDFEGYMSDYI